jgi:RimJ/RimL family protein N-acetyltransferase
MIAFSTVRLILRRWRASDRQPFAKMNADLRVMEYFPHPLTRVASDELADRIEAHFEKYGFGVWAAELLTTGQFIGFIGLNVPTFEAHFSRPAFPAVEIGWRLARDYWGMGLATEGARAVLRYAFMQLQLPEVVSFTTVGNHRSRRVMKKLGMTHNPADDFDHPDLPEGEPLRRHVLYRKLASSFDWAAAKQPAGGRQAP